MSAESPRHVRSVGPLMVPPQPPSDRTIIDAVSGFINDVTLSTSSTVDPKDVIQWARFETTDLNEPTPEGYCDNDVSPLLLILGYGSGVQVWLIPPAGVAQEVLSWRQGTVRVLRILPTPRQGDCFASKRPLIALCDSASPGPTFCALSFISIRGGEQVKSIKFKNQILDVLANKRFVVVSFSERFAVFDAATLEDRMSVTTCYPCPCPMGGSLPINPLALGDGWLAYADKKLNQSKRSSGGCEGEGVTSYTATVLHAAKSLSKGLRGLGESVAHSLAGGRSTSQSPSPPNADIQQPGVITILDIEGTEEEDGQDSEEACDPIVAHFIAHSEAIIAMKFDPSGMLLVTADRRGHDFHVFRINPHPCGPSLASVHHLYILHRGDTTAKVQDIAISCDSRWAAVSTLRGTTHVFAMSPYGGAVGVRTHTSPRVVNRLSRFHRSAGLPIHAPARGKGSPHTMSDSLSQGAWFPNPRLPPYPQPTTLSPLAQLRPTANIPTHTITRTSSGRQRLSSLSEDSNAVPLLARARFGPPPVSSSVRAPVPVAALYLMAANGSLLHLLLHPKPLSSIPKEKICDESCIELEVTSVAQWPLQRPAAAADLLAPLPPSNPLLQPHICTRGSDMHMSEEERWLSQVEIVTHAGPHRRLWMGPQFVFKTYNSTGSSTSLSEVETVEVEASGVARSNPVNMPGVRPIVPVIIDSGSASSLEHSPSDSFRRKSLLAESGRAPSVCDVQLREDLAEAMKEDHGSASVRAAEGRRAERTWTVDPLGCVAVPAPPGPAPPAPEAPEALATSNCDEATFRAVALGALGSLGAPAAQGARGLPATTTIPVQSAAPPPHALPAPPRACPLSTTVVIPAALSDVHQHFTLDIDVNEEMNARESVPTERERQELTESLPKFTPSDDIHPIAESNVKRTPTVKSDSDKIASDDSCKDNKSRVRNTRSRDTCEIMKPRMNDNREFEVCDKKKNVTDLEVSTKDEKDKICVIPVRAETMKKVATQSSKLKKMEFVPKPSLSKESVPVYSDSQEIIRNEPIKKDSVKESTHMNYVRVDPVAEETVVCKETVSKVAIANELIIKEDILEKAVPVSTMRELIEKKSSDSKIAEDIIEIDFTRVNSDNEKLLYVPLNNPDNVPVSDNLLTNKESKSKTKKKGKSKKSQDDLQLKEEEDTFVEIHAIEDKQQQSSGELVSISAPYEEIEPTSCMAKTKKSRISKNNNTEKKDQFEFNDIWDLETEFTAAISPKVDEKLDSKIPEINVKIKSKLKELDFCKTDAIKITDGAEITVSKDSSKPKKSKSLSPYFDRKSTEKRYETEVKDVYVIDTMIEEFPEIQITAAKTRKKSPQPEKNPEIDYIEKPIKSWSSIAASKSKKNWKDEDKNIEGNILVKNKVDIGDIMTEAIVVEKPSSTTGISLQEKLIELCKRNDIMVAECDAPTELNFVEEHHKIIDSPQLKQPLDYGFDDFKPEEMQDSLVEGDSIVTSPLCKINIDSILSTIKETTHKAIESSAFNLIDLEKMPMKKEKGFSVINNDRITSQEVKIDDDKLEDNNIAVMEKSSDDDNISPVLSTDSDKDDKKYAGASNVTLPSTKQLTKSKRSRKKKK